MISELPRNITSIGPRSRSRSSKLQTQAAKKFLVSPAPISNVNLHKIVGLPMLRFIPTRGEAKIRDVNGNIRANVAFTPEANYSL